MPVNINTPPKFSLLLESAGSATANMERDSALFALAEQSTEPALLLRIYTWQNLALTYGYTQKIAELVDLEKARELNLEIARRPTGGGIVCHQPGELTLCLIASKELFFDNLRRSHQMVAQLIIAALTELGIPAELASRRGLDLFREKYCFARPTRYEILCRGKKLVGLAQKRGRRTFLQHVSLQLQPLDRKFSQVIEQKQLDAGQISIYEATGKNLDYRKLGQLIGEKFRGFLNQKGTGTNIHCR